MGIIDALDDTTSEAVESGEAYIKNTKKYYELKVFQQLAILSSSGVRLAICGGLSLLGLIFLAIAIAAALNAYFESKFMGYLIVAFSFFVLVALFYLGRKRVEKKVIEKLAKNYF
jgi:hypothetical protein